GHVDVEFRVGSPRIFEMLLQTSVPVGELIGQDSGDSRSFLVHTEQPENGIASGSIGVGRQLPSRVFVARRALRLALVPRVLQRYALFESIEDFEDSRL